MNLRGKNIVITGCASGIGLEILKLLLKNQCTVTTCDLNIEKLELPSELNCERLFKTRCDISRKEELDSLFEFASDKMEHIDLFIANAGFAYYEKLTGTDWNHISRFFETNVMSFIYCAEKMKELHGNLHTIL